jgi:hypothetical protein
MEPVQAALSLSIFDPIHGTPGRLALTTIERYAPTRASGMGIVLSAIEASALKVALSVILPT